MTARRRCGPTALLALAVAALAVSCGDRTEPADSAPADPAPAAVGRLHAFEEARRSALDVRTAPTSDQVMGVDPVAIRPLADTGLVVGLLRGRSTMVVLDETMSEQQRLATPESPTGLAVTPSGDVLVSGELGGPIARYRVGAGRLEPAGEIRLDGVRSVRALAYGPEGVLYVVEDHDHRLLTASLAEPPGAILDVAPIGLGPRAVLRTARHLVVNCILSHEIVVLPVDTRGVPRRRDAVRIRHDGPFWSVDAEEVDGGLLLAMGGVEDHPLDRRQGSFGYIDSFAYVYRVSDAPPATERLAAIDVSALGVVTPKVVDLRVEGDDVRVWLAGYGDANVAELHWTTPRANRKGTWPPPEVATRPMVPGNVMEAPFGRSGRLLANPLLDAWVIDDGTHARVVPVADPGWPPRSVESRVGEALFFTTLMAPWNRTKGSLSRFTCETCHFEGHFDGRVHNTGRGEVQRHDQAAASVW